MEYFVYLQTQTDFNQYWVKNYSCTVHHSTDKNYDELKKIPTIEEFDDNVGI